MEQILLDEDQINAVFDDLVARNIIFHGDDEVQRIDDAGFEFEFRVCSSFMNKPGTIGNIIDTEGLPTFGPGSDIYKADPKLTVKRINDTHLLVLNRFCVFRPQFLLLTLDSYRRQTERLDQSDFEAACVTMNAFQKEHFIIYNCGPEAGCSRLHKHMQMFPSPENFVMLPDRNPDTRISRFPYFLYTSGNETSTTERNSFPTLFEVYEMLIDNALRAWKMDTGNSEPDYLPHNVILTRRWLMVIPRRNGSFQGVSAGAAAMLGLVWVAEKEQVAQWIELGPSKVLSELGLGHNSKTV